MIPQDLHTTLQFQNVLAPAANNDQGTTALGTSIVDMQDKMGLEFVILLGTLSDANATYAVEVTHGDAVDSESAPTSITDSAPVPDAELLGTESDAGFTFAADSGLRKIGYAGTKRWVKLTITPTGADDGDTPIAVAAVSKPRVRGNATGA